MFSKILIANRGIIQAECVRATQELGAKAAVLYTPEDGWGLGERMADEAYELTSDNPTEAFYDAVKIVEIADRIGADAVHPGYGFLAQDTRFGQLLAQKGIHFIFNSAESSFDVTQKAPMRDLAAAAGLAIVPGSQICSNLDNLSNAAKTLGFPVLVKPGIGIGGRGLRIVNKESELADAYARAVKRNSAPDPAHRANVYCEKYLSTARHIEFPVLRDSHGNVAVLPEVECSLQRRFRKLVIETPSPFPDRRLLKDLETASRRIIERCDFVGCATVEFLLDENNAYFLEVNGYIQPSYPASHAASGIDLLKEQIKIHAGEYLSLTVSDYQPRNHVISVSINAEDPAENFAPSPGKLERFLIKPGLGTTVLSTVWTGENVSTLYDPVIAQVVTQGITRELAVTKLTSALNGYIVEGIKTNLPFLRALVASDWFKEAKIDLSRSNDRQSIQDIIRRSVPEEEETIAALVAALTLHHDSNSQQILEALESNDNYSFWNFTSRLISRNKLQT